MFGSVHQPKTCTANILPLGRWLLPVCIALFIGLVVCTSTSDAMAMPLQDETGGAPVEVSQQTTPLDRGTPQEIDTKGISLLKLLTRGGWFMVPLLILSLSFETDSAAFHADPIRRRT